MLKRALALGISTVAFCSLAFVDATHSPALAGTVEPPSRPAEPPSRPAEPPSRQINMCKSYDDFDTFKDTCVHPAAYGNQLPPNAINIECNKVTTRWVANRRPIELHLSTSVTSSVGASNTKGFCTEDELRTEDVQIESATCVEFQQFEYTYSRTIQATCDDVLRFDNAMALCDATLKTAAAWAQVGTAQLIGEPVNSCGVQMQQPGGEQYQSPQPRGMK